MKTKADAPNNDTHQRILNAAEDLFAKRGYAAVTLRDIATAVNMRQASLYYYAPQGKAQLFVEVMERIHQHHRDGLKQAIADAGSELRPRLRAIADWLLSQPPMDFTRLQLSDIPHLSTEFAQRMNIYDTDPVNVVIIPALQEAKDAGIITTNPEIAAHAFVALMEALQTVPSHYTRYSRNELVDQAIDMMLYGWLKR